MKSAKKLSPSQFKEEEKWNNLTSLIAHEAQKMGMIMCNIIIV